MNLKLPKPQMEHKVTPTGHTHSIGDCLSRWSLEARAQTLEVCKSLFPFIRIFPGARCYKYGGSLTTSIQSRNASGKSAFSK